MRSAVSQIERNTWTKWWWLRVDQLQSWSVDERRAGRAFVLTFFGLSLLISIALLSLMLGLHFGSGLSVGISILVSLVLAPLYVRGVAGDMLSTIVRAGDVAAAKRMGGWVPEFPDDSVFLTELLTPWWLEYKYTYGWSPEERWTRNAIFVIASVLFLVSFSLVFNFLQSLGLSKTSSGLIHILIVLPLTLFLARRFCVWMWPEYVRRADALNRGRRNKKNHKN
jgi:hypothetical protein